MLNLDFNQKVIIDTNQTDWLSSPATGVLRKPLEREELESGHTTSIVQYQKGARFKPHPHPGAYPARTWIRSPHMSEHFPFVKEETIILVKTGHLPLV